MTMCERIAMQIEFFDDLMNRYDSATSWLMLVQKFQPSDFERDVLMQMIEKKYF